MKKRRVLALLLALSLAVSMNGMTVLAAGTGETEVAGLSLEEAGGEAEESSEGDELEGDTDDGEKDSEDKKQEGSEEKSEDGTEEKTEEGTEEGSETDDETGDDSLEDDNTEEVPEEEIPDAEELLPEENLIEETEETVSEEKEQKEFEDQPVVRMVTFMDDTGMRVTYDANEAAAYKYTVTDGVLTAVKNADDSPVSGNVILSQPGNDDPYENFTSIAASVFAGNTEITYVKIPTGVTGISNGAFQGCTALKGIYIPTKVTSIGSNAFEGCFALTQLAIPKSVTSIGAGAFKGDSKLFMVNMKDADYSQLNSIGADAFNGCKALEKFCSDADFVLPGSIVEIGENAFYGCSSISNALMEDSITSIGSAAFKNCTGLTKVNISGNMNIIPESLFENCTSINSVTIGDKKNIEITIKANAFKGCYNLGSIDLPEQVVTVEEGAFASCSNLMRIYIGKRWLDLEEGAFPENEGLCFVSTADTCSASEYVDRHHTIFRFVNVNDAGAEDVYTYTKRLTGDGVSGIKMIVATTPTGKDINASGGVKARTKLYVVFDKQTVDDAGVKLVENSIKCNGTAVKKDSNGHYSFAMPDGGAFITAEFVSKSEDSTIKGLADNVTTELSNGAELKVGQKTRLFLVSDHVNDSNLIPASKIEYWVSNDDKAYASVTDDGTIQALAEGSAVVYASVTGGDGKPILKSVAITITDEAVASIKVKAYDYPSYVTIEENEGVQTAYVDSSRVTQNYTLKLKATAYDIDDDDMATAFTWSTSDKNVAALAKTSTTSSSSINTVTIPKGTDGEATITVTETKKDKKKVTQSFLISVRDYKPRLASSTITVNPYKTEGGVLEIIGAYNNAVTSAELYEEKRDIKSNDFELTLDETGSTDNISRYYVKARPGLKDKTYSVRVRINNSNSNMQVLKIVVKSSSPNPKVAFQKNQAKINLFKANDGTEIKMIVSNLGTEEISACKLEALTSPGSSSYEDDKLFVENFRVELGEERNTVVIKQKSESMNYTSKKKPAVTGYLVLQIKGYDSSKVEKKFKITIPTQTIKPVYMLDRTSDTYNVNCSNQTVKLQLLDKKTKKKIELVADEYDSPIVLSNSVSCVSDCIINSNGELEFVIDGESVTKGAVYIKLHKKDWADEQSLTFTYSIKTTTSNPKISLKGATVTLNNNFADATEEFTFVSNQKDTVLAATQTFDYDHRVRNYAEYEKIDIVADEKGGTVSIESGIATGTYKFTCPVTDSNDNTINRVTLTVKVNNTKPTVSIKGSMSLNLKAKTLEKTEITLTPKNLPEDYELDVERTLDTIRCTTKNQSSVKEKLEWDIEKGGNGEPDKLLVSLKSNPPLTGTYKFTMAPCYTNADNSNSVDAKELSFSVRVYTDTISVNLSAKGKLNLLDRLTGDSKEYKTSNSIIYTPTLKNVKDTVSEAKIFDADSGQPKYDGEQSKRFEVEVLDGKLYVVPKADAKLENNATYQVKIWVKLENYEFGSSNGGGTWVNSGNIIKIKTAQVLPKVTTNVSTLNLYLSNKNYTASFVVLPKEGSVGNVSGISFDEKDTKAKETFVNTDGAITAVPQEDGSLKVTLKLRNTVAYSCNTTNKIKMYIEFEGQGTNTPGTAITMNVKINK